MVHPGRDLAHPDHLLHGHEDELHGQEADTLVEEVHGTEEYQVPAKRPQICSGLGYAERGSVADWVMAGGGEGKVKNKISQLILTGNQHSMKPLYSNNSMSPQ